MIRYKGIFIIFCSYIIISVLTIYFSIFSIFEMNRILTFFSQVSACLISILVFAQYLRMFRIFYKFLDLSIKLNNNENWDEINESYKPLLKLKSHNFMRSFNFSRGLMGLILVLITISIVENLLIIREIKIYSIPVMILIFFIILRVLTNTSKAPEKNIIKWIYDSNTLLNNEFNRLTQFKVEGSSDYFKFVEEDLSKLSAEIDNFGKTQKLDIKNKVLTNLRFLNENSPIIFHLIRSIYEIRGKILTLMSFILELRQKQLIKFQQVEQIKKDELEAKRLRNIEKKEEKFITLENRIDESFKTKSETLSKDVEMQIKDLGNKWEEKISEFNKKISQTYDSNYQRFGQLNEELKENFQKLQSKMTSLFFEKVYQSFTTTLQDEKSIKSYYDEFVFIAELFFNDILDSFENSKLEPIMEKLCMIYESMK